MLSLNEVYSRYIDQDPIRIFQDGAVKSAIILFSFLAITSFFYIDKNLIIISILFIANLSGSILLGSIQAKRMAFIMYLISAIVIINISPYVHDIFKEKFILIVFVVFVAFWIRRFGEAFTIFPIMVVVLTCICFIRFPLAQYNHLSFTFTAILIGLAFYILIIRNYKIMNSEDIEKIVHEFMRLYIRNYLNAFDKAKSRKFTQTDIVSVSNLKYQNINSLKNHGLMFLRKNTQDSWRYLTHNFVVFNRLTPKFILSYKRLISNYILLGFEDNHEVKELLQSLERIFKETLFLMLYIQKKPDLFKKKSDEIEHWKYKLEIGYIQKYQHDKQKRKLLFDCILLLDDMFISLENIKEAYYDLF
ncbi:membrane protein [Francisella hispaniensis]|uniref:membrane protein n=1 Tax=Francisella hispaniensis TaxID=622488 RepID=UPI0005C7668D|nr:membrane protein [Francisella hispaniensis]